MTELLVCIDLGKEYEMNFVKKSEENNNNNNNKISEGGNKISEGQ